MIAPPTGARWFHTPATESVDPMRPVFALTSLLVGCLAIPAGADEAGHDEFMANCAVCHGEYGKGQGELADLLTIEMPDLTGIAARHDGSFPMLDVIHIIDGRSGMRAHGTNMPLWGERFTAPVAEASGPYAAEIAARGRILSIAYYLESIQE